MTYQPSDYLRQIIQEGKVGSIRQALQVELNDLTLHDDVAIKALDWAVGRVPSLLEPLDLSKGALKNDRIFWNEDYFIDQKVELNHNFSRERFEHLVMIQNYLRYQGHPNFRRIFHEEPSTSQPPQFGGEYPRHQNSSKKADVPLPPVAKWVAVAVCALAVIAIARAIFG